MKGSTARWLGLGVLAVLILALALATFVWRRFHQPYRGYEGPEITVEIPAGRDARGILEDLERAAVLRDATLARAYLVLVLDDPPLKAGEYRFSEALSAPEVLDRLIRGEVVSHPVTIVEGLTLEETAEQLAAAGFGDLQTLLDEMRSPARILDLDPEAEDLEGYLFPDTYAFARGTSEEQIVDALAENFRRRFEDEITPLLEEGERPGIRRLVTLASIVEKEAALEEERPLIAGVYAHRLRRGMALAADPTIIFALKRLGRWDGNLRRPDLQLDSPYNTYRYPGLPPGPICSPGLASLQAAARPPEVPYLYFVSRNDGSHVFAATLREHNRNVERWQRQYWRERWRREREQGRD